MALLGPLPLSLSAGHSEVLRGVLSKRASRILLQADFSLPALLCSQFYEQVGGVCFLQASRSLLSLSLLISPIRGSPHSLSETLFCKLLFPLGPLCPFSICIEASFPRGLFLPNLVMLSVESHIHTPGLSDSSGRSAPLALWWNNTEAPGASPSWLLLFSWHLSFMPKAIEGGWGRGNKKTNKKMPLSLLR